jgi:hypothetical protein
MHRYRRLFAAILAGIAFSTGAAADHYPVDCRQAPSAVDCVYY